MGRLSSLLIGTITGASVAYFLTTEKGKELTGKVKGFVKEYQENPQEVHDSVKQSAMELSKQASDAMLNNLLKGLHLKTLMLIFSFFLLKAF